MSVYVRHAIQPVDSESFFVHLVEAKKDAYDRYVEACQDYGKSIDDGVDLRHASFALTYERADPEVLSGLAEGSVAFEEEHDRMPRHAEELWAWM